MTTLDLFLSLWAVYATIAAIFYWLDSRSSRKIMYDVMKKCSRYDRSYLQCMHNDPDFEGYTDYKKPTNAELEQLRNDPKVQEDILQSYNESKEDSEATP